MRVRGLARADIAVRNPFVTAAPAAVTPALNKFQAQFLMSECMSGAPENFGYALQASSRRGMRARLIQYSFTFHEGDIHGAAIRTQSGR